MFIPFTSPPVGSLFFRHCETPRALWQSGHPKRVMARGCKPRGNLLNGVVLSQDCRVTLFLAVTNMGRAS